LALVGAIHAPARTIETNVVEDVWAESNNPNTINNESNRISRGVFVRNNAAVSRAGFLQFSLPLLPKEVVTGAVVLAYATSIAVPPASAIVVGVKTNIALTTMTWNVLSNANVIAGRDGVDYHVLWGTNVTVFSGQEWPIAGWTDRTATSNRFTATDTGFVKFINDRPLVGGSKNIILGFGGPSGVADYTFSFYSKEAWSVDPGTTPPNVPGIFSARLTVYTRPPDSGTLISIR
jgi:hypothetical protein